MSTTTLRKQIPVILAIVLIFSLIPKLSFAAEDVEWWNFRNNYENNGVTDVKTASSADEAWLKWGSKMGTGWAFSPTPPVIVNGSLYIGASNKIYKVDKETGAILQTSDNMVGNVGYAMNPIVYAEGMFFVQVGNGTIQAMDATTLKPLWSSKRMGGQTVSPIAYKQIDGEGYVYIGTWSGENRDGTFFAVKTKDEDTTRGDEVKEPAWSFVPSVNDAALPDDDAKKRGFYWAGAYATDNYVAVGSDDGTSEGNYTANAVFYTLNPKTGEIIDRMDGVKGDIRTTVVYDNGNLYFSTKGGELYRVPVDENGKLGAADKISLGGMTTASPVIYKDKIYIGVAGPGGQFSTDGGHRFAVINNVPGEALTEEHGLPIPGYPQAAALVSTAYEDQDFNKDGTPDGRVYIYFTYNAPPGGLYYTYYEPGMTEAPKAEALFIPPAEMQQYCISTICADKEGIMYYKNDSGHVMAVEANLAYLENAVITPDIGDAVWSENFDTSINSYKVKVNPENNKVKLSLTMPEGATATVNDTAYDKENGLDLTLDEQGRYEAVVKVSKDHFSRTYTILIERESQVSTLKDLKVSGSNTYNSTLYDLIPGFHKDIKEYTTALLPQNKTFYNVWPAAENADAKVQVFPGKNVDTTRTSDFIEATGEFKVTATNQGFARYAVYALDPKLDSEVTIRVTSESGQFKNEYKLTLSRTVNVAGVELDPASIEVVESGDATLTPIFTPPNASIQDVTWTSEDEAVATVENGKVTGVSTGETTVTVTTVDGGKTAQATVTVTPLDDYKTTIKESLDTYKNADDYRDAEKAELAKAIADGKVAIDAATDKKGVDEALAAAKTVMDGIKTDALLTEEESAAAKEVDDKIAAIGEVTLDSKTVIEEARAAYDALSAGAKEKVTKLADLEAAEAKLAELEKAAALEKAKVDAKAALDNINIDDYEDAQKAEVRKAIEDGKAAIDAATTTVNVTRALNNAKSKIGRVPTKADIQLEKDTEITVYVTMAKDGTFKIGNDPDATTLGAVPFKVGYFDLKQYGLEEFYRYESAPMEEGGGYIGDTVIERPTVLHAFIKFTEKYYLGGEKLEIPSDGLDISGSATSMFMNRFFGGDLNLNYYVNNKYPLMGPGWGATADYILLEDGDKISVGWFDDWNFWMEGASFMHFDNVVKTVEVGKPLESTINGTGHGENYTTEIMPKVGETILVDGVEKATSGEEGKFTLTFDTPGTYYVTSASISPNNNFLIPAAMKVTVTEKSLDTIKEEAKSELDNYKDPADYRDEQKTELTNAIADGKTAIDAATDQAGIESALEAAKTIMDGIKTDAQLTEEEAAAAKEVDDKIAAIGEVSLESEAAIEEARAAYDALSAGAKEKVTKLADLEAAEAKLAELKAADALTKAKADAKTQLDSYKDPADYRDAEKTELANAIANGKTAIDEATETEDVDRALAAAKVIMDGIKTDAQLTEEEAAAAKEVDDKIAAIGEVTLEKASDIQLAREAYDNLTDLQKEKVTKLPVLEEAEQRLEQLKKEAADQEIIDKAAAKGVEDKINAIGEPDLSKEDAVKEARVAFDALTPAQKAFVPNEDVLISAEEKIAALLKEPLIEIDYANSSETNNYAEFLWVKGESEKLVVRVLSDYDTFLNKITVDGTVLDPKYYTVTDGSILVDFNKAYLDSLSIGKHNFEVYTKNGYAAGTILVSEKATPPVVEPEKPVVDPEKPVVEPVTPTDQPKPSGTTDTTAKAGETKEAKANTGQTPKTDDPFNMGGAWLIGAAAMLICIGGIRGFRKNH